MSSTFEKAIFYLNISQDVIIALGIIGNVLSFLVFSRRAFDKTPIQTYGRALAIFDCFTIIQLTTQILALYFNIDLFLKSNLSCKLLYYAIDGLAPNSSWILVLLSIDTVISISILPSSNKLVDFIRRKNVRISIILLTVLLHLSIFSLIPIELEIVNVTKFGTYNSTIESCDLHNIRNAKTLAILYFVQANFIPFFLTTLTTVIISVSLYRSRKKSLNMKSSKLRKSRDRKFALNSIALNVIFILLTSPLVFSYIFSTYNYYDAFMIEKATAIFFDMNFSIHFVTHFVVNSLFRKEFLDMIVPKWISQSNKYI